jgi:glycosyltransferase involved in cell wall biosynthesis
LVYDDSECFPAVYEGVLRGITSVLEHFVMSNADLVISVSQELASLRTNQGANAVKVIEHGVYYDSFRAAYLQRLKRIDSDFTPRTVVFAGNLTKLLSGPLLAQVISGVSETRPDAKFRLIGTCEPGVMRGFKETAAQLGLCDNIIVEGVVPYTKLPEVFAQCDIGLVNLTSPELPYGTTMKAVLYLAAGLPIIAPARGPISRLFCCGDVGRMVTPSQPELVKAILSALSMSAVEYVKVSTRATETARKSDWKLLGTTYVSLILQSAV